MSFAEMGEHGEEEQVCFKVCGAQQKPRVSIKEAVGQSYMEFREGSELRM